MWWWSGAAQVCCAVRVTGGAAAAPSSSSLIIHTSTNSENCTLLQFLFINFLHLLMCVFAMAAGHIGCTLDTNRQFGEAKTRPCGGVEFSGCSRSLCRAAGCAYLLLWSVEHKEPNMNWKGEQIPSFPTPMLPTSLSTSPRPPGSVILSAHRGHASPRPCLLGRWHPACDWARLSSCRGSAVVSAGLEGLSLQRGKKSSGSAKVWWHNKSGGKQLRGSECHNRISNHWKGAFM